jgi:lipopolysaccharide/colanic/teichoic acid biosynthesis glycosyltransferase
LVEIGERFSALLLLGVTLPMLAAAALATWIASGRTPLIAHKRVGWKGSVLWMLKLRTMWDAGPPAGGRSWVEFIDDEDGPGRKDFRDPRVRHGLARFCRRHSLDELPQLWHVIRGEMILIGPRPLTRQEVERYYGKFKEEILAVKPGIAGLWQVSGRNRLTYEDRVRLDLQFVRHRSLGMYCRILLATVAEVWSGADAW